MSTKYNDEYTTPKGDSARLADIKEYASSDDKPPAVAVRALHHTLSASGTPYASSPAADSPYRTPSTSPTYVPQRNGRLVDTIRGIGNV